MEDLLDKEFNRIVGEVQKQKNRIEYYLYQKGC